MLRLCGAERGSLPRLMMVMRGEGWGVGAGTTNPGSSHAPPFRCRCSARPRGGSGRPTRGPAMSSGQGRCWGGGDAGMEVGGGLQCVLRGDGSAGEAPLLRGVASRVCPRCCCLHRARGSFIPAPPLRFALFSFPLLPSPRPPALPTAARPHPASRPLLSRPCGAAAVRGDAAGRGALLSFGCAQEGR